MKANNIVNYLKSIKNGFKSVKNAVDKYLGIFVVSLFIVIQFLLGDSACLIKSALGIPCPGCGMTRAYLYLSHFDFEGALFFHPLIIIPPIIGGILLFKSSKYISSVYKSNIFWFTILFLVIGTWIIRMMLFFPDIVPMDLNREAILFKILNFFVLNFKGQH